MVHVKLMRENSCTNLPPSRCLRQACLVARYTATEGHQQGKTKKNHMLLFE